LLLARVPHPPEFLDDPPPIFRGAADRPLLKLLPPKCPPPPPWNPPPPLLPIWNPPPPREPPFEPPPPREPPPRCLPNAAFGAPARARATMDANRTLKTVGVLISVSSSLRSRTGRNRDLENRWQKRRRFSPRLHLPRIWAGRISLTSCPPVSQHLRGRKAEEATC